MFELEQLELFDFETRTKSISEVVLLVMLHQPDFFGADEDQTLFDQLISQLGEPAASVTTVKNAAFDHKGIEPLDSDQWPVQFVHEVAE
jgi:hypothetical protein